MIRAVRHRAFRLAITARSLHFYNDDYRAPHPFENTVQLIFHDSIPTSDEFHSYFKRSNSGITGAELWYRDGTAFINFSTPREKYAQIDSHFSEPFPFPHSVHEYTRVNDFTRDYADIRFPFSSSAFAAYRPSLHSEDLLVRHFSKYGHINGLEVQGCPYDADRAFLYCNYQNRKSLTAALRLPVIPGYKVGNDSAFFSDVSENVDVFRQGYNEMRRYPVNVDVFVSVEPCNVILDEVSSLLGQYGDIVSTNRVLSSKRPHLRVEFAYPISVYRMFYWRTMFGRLTDALPKSGAEIQISIPLNSVSLSYKHRHTVELNGVTINENEDLHEFCSRVLDAAGCNPGIISANYMAGQERIFMKVLNAWYAADISHKLQEFFHSDDVGDIDQRYCRASVNRKSIRSY